MLGMLGGVVVWVAALSCGPTVTTPKIEGGVIADELHEMAEHKELRRQDPDRVYRAISVAGQRRVVEAIPDLIELLSFRYRYDWENRPRLRVSTHEMIDPALRYPATEALAEIGQPALAALVRVVGARNFDSLESRNARCAIRLIFRDNARADEFFKQAGAAADTEEARQRLLKAAQTADQDMKLTQEDLRP